MRKTIIRLLQWQAKRYLRRVKPRVVVVTGSVGKTSTTQAIATVLREAFSVRTTVKNYNTDVGVPCSIFHSHLPENLKNPFSWIALLVRHELQLLKHDNTHVLVLELGTDAQGDIAAFSWLKPDIAVVTAVAEEHMEYFHTLENVAKEELSVAAYSAKTLINKQMVDASFIGLADTDELYNYSREDIVHVDLKQSDLQVIGEHSVDAIAAALAVGRELGLGKELLHSGAMKVTSQFGRMNKLNGIQSSTIIDDTYNASPQATEAALLYLIAQKAPQRIALLGNMNELGDSSAEAHKQIGSLCNPKKLDAVITLGDDANNYTATAAKEQGCIVYTTKTPYEAAEKIKEIMKVGALILCKGSQNGVFAEETVKLLLENPEDEKYLVRQSPFWLKKKAKNFTS